MIRLQQGGARADTTADHDGFRRMLAVHHANDPAARMITLEPPQSWLVDAACAGMSPEESDRIFFPTNQWNQEAVEICGTCPVTAECITFGAGYEGIYGGLTLAQRTSEKQSA